MERDPITTTTQADRREKSRAALLEAAARGLSRHGYKGLVLEDVARDAGYTRGALYHQFNGKEDLALAVVGWVESAWYEEVGSLTDPGDPLGSLKAIARGHAIFCRRDVAGVMMTLRVEFSEHDHPVGRAVKKIGRRLVRDCTALIEGGRRAGTIRPGPPARTVALAVIGALEGLVINLAGRPPHDADLAEELIEGMLASRGPG